MTRSQILTDRQQLELNKAIIQYLEPILNEHDIQHSLLNKISEILNIPINSKDDNVIPNYLEKKWSTVLRLQRKIIDLENEIGNLRTIIDSQQPNSSSNLIMGKDKVNWMPSSSIKTFKTQSHQLISSVAIHPSLPIITNGCTDGSIIIWNLTNDESGIPDKIIKAHTRNINRIKWSNEAIDISNKDSSNKNYVLASCSSDLSIKIWDGSNYKQIRTLTGHEHTVSSITFSKTKPNILYSVSRDKTVKIWDLINGYCVKSFIGHSDWVRDIDVISINSKISLNILKSSNELGDFIVTCSNDQSIRLSHAESGTGLALLIGHTHVIERIKFLPLHSNPIIDKYLKENQSLYPNISQDLITDSIYTNTLGYKYCISAGRDNLIKLWLLPPPVIRPHRHPLPSQVNNSQGWLIADFIGHQSWVKALSIHPNGRFIFSAGDDKFIKIWDLASLNAAGNVKCIKTLSGHEGFISDIDFANFETSIENMKNGDNKDNKEKTDKTDEESHNALMKYIETKMRCLFISGAVDNSIKLWS